MSKKQKSVGNVIFRVIILFIIMITIYIAYEFIYKVNSVNNIFKEIESEEALVSEYIVYGTHLNIKGNLKINNSNIKKVSLELNTTQAETTEEIDISYKNTTNGIEFYTADLINEGIDLEKIPINTYYLFIKVDYTDGTTRRYSLKDNTEYENDSINYYTITKNGKNNKIDIEFSEYSLSENEIEYMSMVINSTKLPEKVYDVVIDPGHGGADVGAESESGKYNEATLTLDIAQKVKTELEKLGLKVLITRDGTEGKEFNVYSVYDEDGRVNLTGASKAKYVFSIHLNSIEQANSQSGVEIYAPSKSNLDFAKSLADSIVKYANTKYSALQVDYKKDNGVYVRTLTEEDIIESAETAKKKGYTPYDIKKDTTYLYMIRETGGLATGAYVDGRNTAYGKNLYYNSNIGVEAYLLELGYINNKADLQNILNNQEGYVEGIVKAIENKLLGTN